MEKYTNLTNEFSFHFPQPNAGLSPSSSDSLYPLSLILFPFTRLPVVFPQEGMLSPNPQYLRIQLYLEMGSM